MAGMTLSDQDIDEFIEIFAKEYGERLTREEARPIATNVVTLYRLIMRPLQKNDDSIDATMLGLR